MQILLQVLREVVDKVETVPETRKKEKSSTSRSVQQTNTHSVQI